jgi:hypothetical protein
MNTIDRYLLAVRVFLPRTAQRDIIDELSEDLRSRVEDREAVLGRPLTESEQQGLVKELGHPALLAGKYGRRRHLIGPEIFPFYWLVLRLALVVGVAVHVAVTIALIISGRTDQAIRQAFVVLPSVAFLQFGIITIVFTVLDNSGALARFGREWSPRALPTRVRHVQPLFQLVLVLLFAGWWFAGLRQPFLILGPGAALVELAPIWSSLFTPMLLLALADVAWQVLGLIRPQWKTLRALMRIALGGLQLLVLYFLARAGEWLLVAPGSREIESVKPLVTAFNL